MRNNLFIGSLFSLLLFTGCKQSTPFLYQDRVQKVDCPKDTNKDLMHEALYSFQEDLGVYYNEFTDFKTGSSSYYMEGYRQYVYFGFSGIAAYNNIVSQHSIDVLEALKKVPDLWIEEAGEFKLNYHGDYVSCLFDNIRNEELHQKFKSLLEVNYLNPKIIAETMRVNVIEVIQDPYLAMYMALDSYYVYLMNMKISPKTKEHE